jgi:hypothetical protein
MRKVLYILQSYPQISQTYIETELRALDGRFRLEIVTTGGANISYEWHHPYTAVKGPEELVAFARAAQPDIIHGHYANMIPSIARVSREIDVPFTLRSHSFDVFGPESAKLVKYRDAVNSPLCAGVLGFPPAMDRFKAAGWDAAKVVPCYPVVEYDWFYDRSSNDEGVMNVGACIRKKKMVDFLELGTRMPHKRFDLYALGYVRSEIEQVNDQMGRPVNMMAPVEPKLMPPEYKKHAWMVYTGNPQLPTIGWPMAVAEAQASGVGICIQRVRPDLEEYVGGAGFLFDTLDEAAAIISNPVPDEVRERGFLQARKSDIHSHIDSLVNLWRDVL